MNVSFAPEVRLLLMACTSAVSVEKKAQITQFLNEHPIDWERLDTVSIRHRLKPFLYQTLSQIPTVPEAYVASLKRDCQLTATDNLLKLHQYKAVQALLTENAIDCEPLKGIYLAEQFYPVSSLRVMGDIDLLVSKADILRTVALLQEHDFHLSPKHRLHWQQGEQRLLEDLFEIDLFKRFSSHSQFDIDLHWNVMGFNKDYVLFDLAYVRSEPSHLPERKIVLLVTHHGVNGVWQQINYINDLYFSLNEVNIDWPWLLQELRRYGFEQVFLAGLYWCCQIWALRLPPDVQERVASPRISSLANAYAKSWSASASTEFSYLILSQLTFFLKAQTQFTRQLQAGGTFLSSRVFRYSLFKVGNRLVYLPKETGFFTLFIRLFQSAFRFLPARFAQKMQP